MKGIARIMKKISKIMDDKLLEQRRLNEKSIKSYEVELEKLNNLVEKGEK